MLHEANHPDDRGAGDLARESKPVGWGDLPDGMRRTLSSIPMSEWQNVMVTVCPSELMMDATALVATFARVWEKSRAAEDFRVDRLTGDERERYRKEFEQGLKLIAGTTIALGVRARLYGELQWEKSLLSCYAQEAWQSSWTKAMARSAHSDGAAAKGEMAPNPKPKPASHSQKPRSEPPKPAPFLRAPMPAQAV